MKKLIIILFLASCSKLAVIPEKLDGNYSNGLINLSFNDGVLNGSTYCNNVYGSYEINENTIIIEIGSTKIGCENEFNISLIRGENYYSIGKDYIKLTKNDFELILYKEN